MAQEQRLEVRLRHVLPEGQDQRHLLRVRAVALPLRRSRRWRPSPRQRPDPARVPVAPAERAQATPTPAPTATPSVQPSSEPSAPPSEAPTPTPTHGGGASAAGRGPGRDPGTDAAGDYPSSRDEPTRPRRPSRRQSRRPSRPRSSPPRRADRSLARRLRRQRLAQDGRQLIPLDEERVVALGRADLAVVARRRRPPRAPSTSARTCRGPYRMSSSMPTPVRRVPPSASRPNAAVEAAPAARRCRGGPWPRPGCGRSPGRTGRRACGPGGRGS